MRHSHARWHRAMLFSMFHPLIWVFHAKNVCLDTISNRLLFISGSVSEIALQVAAKIASRDMWAHNLAQFSSRYHCLYHYDGNIEDAVTKNERGFFQFSTINWSSQFVRELHEGHVTRGNFFVCYHLVTRLMRPTSCSNKSDTVCT